ncbi:MAG TPA: hypothetical protein VE931_11910 [Pyrinomonadaceae bacterium]|nr:hypothetical protein [Pyrinomonadaceae bacterium]
MKKVFLLSSLLLLSAISQCDNHSNKTSNPILGRYELTGRDNSGQLTFTGIILFVSLEQNYLKGQCKIKREQGAPGGLYEKDGNCEALMDGKKIDLDSAPQLDDAGLLLEGEFDGVAINGIWKLDGFVTSGPLGKFEAVKTTKNPQ